jgi:hypothetical protein
VSKIRGHRGAALGRVVNSVADQRQHVLVGERVEDVLGLASPPYQANDGQGLQSRGDGGNLLTFVFGQFRHTRFALGKPEQKPKPLRVAERPEYVGGGFNLRA